MKDLQEPFNLIKVQTDCRKDREPDIVTYKKILRLQSAGHLIRMEDERPATAIQSNPGSNRLQERQRARCEDNVTEDAGIMGSPNVDIRG